MKLNTIQLLFLLLALFVTSSLALPIASVDDGKSRNIDVACEDLTRALRCTQMPLSSSPRS